MDKSITVLADFENSRFSEAPRMALGCTTVEHHPSEWTTVSQFWPILKIYDFRTPPARRSPAARPPPARRPLAARWPPACRSPRPFRMDNCITVLAAAYPPPLRNVSHQPSVTTSEAASAVSAASAIRSSIRNCISSISHQRQHQKHHQQHQPLAAA